MKKFNEFQQYKRCKKCNKIRLVEELENNKCNECIPTEKECSRCKIIKPLADFATRNDSVSDGKTSACKACVNQKRKLKKEEKRTSIKIINKQRTGTIEWEIYQFFGQHQIKLSEKEIELICQKLKESNFKLSTLDEILKQYKVGIEDYLMEFQQESKAVLQYEIDDKYCENPIARFESTAEASIFLRGDKNAIANISQSCRKNMVGLGYRWKFESED